MRILYFETTAYYPSSAHFLEALRELGAERGWSFEFVDQSAYIPTHSSLGQRIVARLLGRPSGYHALNKALLDRALEFHPNLVLIGKGQFISPDTLKAIREATGAVLVNWATDDPFNPCNTSPNLVNSIPLYDLYVSTKLAVIPDLKRVGVNNTYVRFGYKPEVHYPETLTSASEQDRFACEVAFIGGADADRVPYFEKLLRGIPGLKLVLYGGYWNRYPALRPYWRGEVFGREYRLAVAGAKIVVNLVRRGNRDDHVMRTFELPACGAFVLAERSVTHCELFKENVEAAFFSSPDEMVERIRYYLPRDEERRSIAEAGRREILAGHHTYRDRLLQIIESAPSVFGAAGAVPTECL
ncbi:MAG: glycosyltransferase [Candidatus Binataceae bacterium]|nr:glycosyltransferase [Candidatus Binataceae bacterium]